MAIYSKTAKEKAALCFQLQVCISSKKTREKSVATSKFMAATEKDEKQRRSSRRLGFGAAMVRTSVHLLNRPARIMNFMKKNDDVARKKRRRGYMANICTTILSCWARLLLLQALRLLSSALLFPLPSLEKRQKKYHFVVHWDLFLGGWKYS